MSEILVKTEGLSKTYTMGKDRVQALSEVNLQVNKGEFISILGPSGSGKTTLLSILGCLDKPTSGRVIFDRMDVTELPEKELCKIRRNKIGFIFQTFNLLPYLSAIENVELPMEGTKKSRDERRKSAHELLSRVGLSGRERHRPNRLSAGEQQRVAIARALANNPTMVLADEPTGNLDKKTKYEIMTILARCTFSTAPKYGGLVVDQGTTVIMVTHDSDIASQTGKMLYLDDGKLKSHQS